MTPVEALQATLAGEHAAVYVYGVLGGRVSASSDPRLADRIRAAYTEHRSRRDEVTAMVAGEDARPVAAAVSYTLAHRAHTPDQLADLARLTEQRSAAVYADMVASTSGAHRQWAIGALRDAAVRSLRFGGEPQAFPGAAELQRSPRGPNR